MNISKHALRKLRHWAKFQDSTTVLEAHSYLLETRMAVEDRKTIRELASSAVEIRNFLTKICGYQVTRGVRNFGDRAYVILQNSVTGIKDRRAQDRYVEVLTAFYRRSR